jgi:Spy/CpxP family protein refolding chaperone
MKHLRIIVTVALAVLMAAPAMAQRGGRGPGKHFGPSRLGDAATTPMLNMLSKRLDLTEQQKTNITAIVQETRESVKEPAGEVREIMRTAFTKISAELTDEQKAKLRQTRQGLFQAAGGFLKAHGPEMRDRAKMAGQEMNMRFAPGRVSDLTDDQRTQLQALGKEIRERHEALREEMKPRMERIRSESEEKLRGILTEEQFKQMQENRKEMRMRGGSKPGFGRGPGKGFGGKVAPDAPAPPAQQ